MPAEDLQMIVKEVAVKIPSRMAYVKTDLHRVPHGSDWLFNKPKTDLLLDKMHVPHATVNHGESTGMANLLQPTMRPHGKNRAIITLLRENMCESPAKENRSSGSI